MEKLFYYITDGVTFLLFYISHISFQTKTPTLQMTRDILYSYLLIPVIILIIPLSFLIFNCSRYESLLISIVSLLVFVLCTNFGNAILPLNYFYFNKHYYFLCICTFLCNKKTKKVLSMQNNAT